MDRYDLIIVGCGAAGLSLACELAHSPLRASSILLVDRDPKDRNDRTWCFWAERPTRFEPIVSRSWRRLRFASPTFTSALELDPYRYQLIRGLDFYDFARTQLAACPGVALLRGEVSAIEDGPDGATIVVDGMRYAARWVFDSRFHLPELAPDPARYTYLQQRFQGWEVETTTDAFDHELPTLLDFRTPQQGAVCFCYVLPFSARGALVERVACGPPGQDATGDSAALRTYLRCVLGVDAYRLRAREGGALPLTDAPFPRRVSEHVMTIGIAGGRVKPTSGYAFMRIQHDSAAIVRSLLEQGHPFAVPPDPRRYQLYDALLLDLMRKHPDSIGPIFTTLFRRNPIKRILRFLDEAGSPGENVRLIATLPPRRFGPALLRRCVPK